LFAHRMDGRRCHATHSAHPACMRNADNSPARVMKQNGHTVRKAHEEDNISLTIGLTFRARRAGTDHICAVNLPYIEDRFRLTIERLERQQAISSYPCQVITNSATNIERDPRVRADPTMPCK